MKYYKLCLHAEEVSKTEKGEEVKSLDDDFEPVCMGEYKTKEQMDLALSNYENIGLDEQRYQRRQNP